MHIIACFKKILQCCLNFLEPKFSLDIKFQLDLNRFSASKAETESA